MARSKLGLRTPALCLCILGLVAYAGGTAHAEPDSKWGILKANGELVKIAPASDPGGIGDALLPLIQITEIEEKHLTILTAVSGQAIQILCTGATLEENVTLILNGAVSLGRVELTGCTIKIGGTVRAVCKPHSKGKPEGSILSEKGYGLIRLHIGIPTVLFLPDVGETLLSIILGQEGESECSLGENLPLSGKLAIRDCGGFFKQEKVVHLINEFSQLTDMWVLNKTAEHKTVIDGSALVGLIGEHKGLEWAGLPANI